MAGLEEFKNQTQTKGWFLFENFIDQNLVRKMLLDLEKSYEFCRKIQIRNGVDNSEGTCHHIIGLGSSFMDCLSEFEKLDPYMEEYFGGKYILNSFGGNILTRGISYANNIHRDIRSYSGGLPLMLNTIIMLDDFTPENGATRLMNRGHEWSHKPEEDIFNNMAFQIIGKAGSVVMFNSNLWHQAGENRTDEPRRSVTPIFSRPFIKQGYDYARALGHHKNYSDYLMQVLGYNSRVPSTLSDWYKPEDQRMYRSSQG